MSASLRVPNGFDAAARKRLEVLAGLAPSGFSIVTADTVAIHPVRWLWQGWLARGKLHLLAGAPGCGKTTLAVDLVARLTRGGGWPDGSRASVGKAFLWSGEDSIADTLAPRLLAAGGDPARVSFVQGAFDVSTDVGRLADALEAAGGVDLVLIDPVVSALAGDSHRNAEVRRALQPLADLAERLDCAVLGICHFAKGSTGRDPVERLNGSIALGAAARVVLVATKSEDGRLLARAKSNIGGDSGGFRYELEQRPVPGHAGLYASAVAWGEPVSGSARDLLAVAEAPQEDELGGSIGEACDFLEALLADGPVPSKIVQNDARGAGHAWRTTERAAKRLGVERVKDGMRGGWTWRLPPKTANEIPEEREECQQNRLAAFADVGGLRASCDECRHVTRFGNCGTPVAAGLSESFELIAHLERGKNCKAFESREEMT